jgi:hypothetical protein
MNAEATGLARKLERQGYNVVRVELSEMRKAGGGPKCCTLEIREEIRAEIAAEIGGGIREEAR